MTRGEQPQGLGQPLPGAYSVEVNSGNVMDIGEVPGDNLPSEKERYMEEKVKEQQ